MCFGKPINGIPKAGLSAEGTQHREIGIPISANNASWVRDKEINFAQLFSVQLPISTHHLLF
ncbi:hypothetical protein WL244_13835 [Staphylococcus ureilyticus]|uniref:hypothetical protein n=1 Tax=Staphylococcus ureilyticus TaxID=94138 RepID=UPI0030BBD210